MDWRRTLIWAGISLTGLCRAALADDGQFTLREVTSAAEPILSLRRGYRLLDGQFTTSSSQTFTSSYINFIQPAGAHTGRFPDTVEFPAASSGQDHNFAVQVSAEVQIPTAGRWSIGMAADGGARLSINGKSFRDVSSGRLATRIRPITFKEAGTYQLTVTYFNHKQPGDLELFASPGNFAHFNARRANYQLIGNVDSGGVSLEPSGSPQAGGGNTSGGLAPVTVASGTTLSTEPNSTQTGLLTTGDENWIGGGTYLWKINNVSGTPGNSNGWDQITTPALSVSSVSAATPFTIALESFNGDVAGSPAGISSGSPGQTYQWTIAHSDAPVTINGVNAVAGNLLNSGFFTLDTSGFTVDGESVPSSEFELNLVASDGGDDLQLDYTAEPEPGAVLLAGCGLVPLLMARRRPRMIRSITTGPSSESAG